MKISSRRSTGPAIDHVPDRPVVDGSPRVFSTSFSLGAPEWPPASVGHVLDIPIADGLPPLLPVASVQ